METGHAQVSHHWIKGEIKERIKDFLNSIKIYNMLKLIGNYKSSTNGEIDSNKYPHKEVRESSH